MGTGLHHAHAQTTTPAAPALTCGREDPQPLPLVELPAPAPQALTEAERACWIDWDRAREMVANAANVAVWLDVREAGATQRLGLGGALAVPSEQVADKAALRGLQLLVLGEGGDLRTLSRQCVAWRQSGRFSNVHVVLGGRAAAPPTVVSAAEYRQAAPDRLWRVVTVGLAPAQANALPQPPALAIAAADAAGLQSLRQVLEDARTQTQTQKAPPWLVVAADAAAVARLQAWWSQRQPAQALPASPVLWLDAGLAGYRSYLIQQQQLASHTGHALPRQCGL
ncbi:hypothetical protein FQR65_LT08003 [Abscondita terminalis]|nr:hypothetical protein FQR65_LT08003 [Abscondita terminalis]